MRTLKSRQMRPLLILWSVLLPLFGQEQPIRYTLRFPAPHTHYVEVEALIPSGGQPQVELMMAVWTPGSYLVREYAKDVEALTARTEAGAPLAVEKRAKNRWRVTTAGQPRIIVQYRVYCHTMSVQGAWVDSSFAVLNGAPVFLTLAGGQTRPHEVRLELPPGWKTSISGLQAASSAPHHYRAADFDTLVDSPILAGNPAIYEFEVGGKKHYLVNEGEGGVWDGPRSARDVEKIVREHFRMWGSLPYDKYVFLNVISEASGGLEHKNSTLLMTTRWATRTRAAYRRWLSLVSHEYFHTWNVKRLRPVELGPFNYEAENYTRSLWISEGFTSYYAPLALHRAGLIRRDEFLEEISQLIRTLQTTPGRLSQPLELSSFDSWIKQYRPNENSPNTAISYYTKGAVVGLLLDARIRKNTQGARSLDDVMRLAYERFSGARGFTPLEFRETAAEYGGPGLKEWFAKVLETTEELDYSDLLEWFGLRFQPQEAAKPEGRPQTVKAWTGLVTRVDEGRLLVSRVRRGTPGYDAGFNVDDEILAIDDYRVRPNAWASWMEYYRPGDKVSVLIARRDKLMRLEIVLGKEPADRWKLEADPQATEAQKARLEAWLSAS